jgi:hypothetical protein
MKKLLIPFLTVLFLFSCKDIADVPSVTYNISIEKTDYAAGEIGIITLASTDFQSLSLKIVGYDEIETSLTENYLAFLLPTDLQVGEYVLELIQDDKEYEFEISIIISKSKQEAQEDFNDIVEEQNKTIAELELRADTLSGIDQQDALADIDTLKNRMSSYLASYNSLSEDDKEKVNAVLAANKWWMDDLSTSIKDLEIETQKLKYGVRDYTLETAIAIKRFVQTGFKLRRSVVKSAIVTAIGLELGGIPGVIIGGVAVGKLLIDFDKHNSAMTDLLNVVFKPFQQMFLKQKADLQFALGEEKELVAQLNFRSLNKEDAASSNSLTAEFYSTAVSAKELWQKAKDLIKIKLSKEPIDVKSIENSKEEVIQVHSKYLDVRNISNKDIEVSINREDGFFLLTFTGDVDDKTDFTFDLVYESEDYGLLSQEFSATLEKEQDIAQMLIDYGPWKSRVFAYDGVADTMAYAVLSITGYNCRCFKLEWFHADTKVILDRQISYIQKTEKPNTFETKEKKEDVEIELELVIDKISETELILGGDGERFTPL